MKKPLKITCIIFAILCIAGVFYLRTQYVVPVVMYHSVDDRWAETKLSVSPESFERQMRFLKERKYNVVTLEELTEIVSSGEKIPHKTITLTFDDGFENNYKNAYPVLKKYGLPATIFVIAADIDTEKYLTEEQIKEMSENGIVTIGSHTMNHRWLPSLTDEELETEVVGSKESLESLIDKDVDFFCYPLGGFDERVRQKVIEAGYKGAVATNPGPDYPAHDIYAMKRVRISRTSDNLFVFWIETSGFYTLIKEIRDED